jgi:hypothetical protein
VQCRTLLGPIITFEPNFKNCYRLEYAGIDNLRITTKIRRWDTYWIVRDMFYPPNSIYKVLLTPSQRNPTSYNITRSWSDTTLFHETLSRASIIINVNTLTIISGIGRLINPERVTAGIKIAFLHSRSLKYPYLFSERAEIGFQLFATGLRVDVGDNPYFRSCRVISNYDCSASMTSSLVRVWRRMPGGEKITSDYTEREDGIENTREVESVRRLEKCWEMMNTNSWWLV